MIIHGLTSWLENSRSRFYWRYSTSIDSDKPSNTNQILRGVYSRTARRGGSNLYMFARTAVGRAHVTFLQSTELE
jgi:hypothetical protein